VHVAWHLGLPTRVPIAFPHPLQSLLGDRPQSYSVVAIGGHQYRIQPGEILEIEKIPLEKGDEFVFDKVLMNVNGDDVQIGQPYLSGVTVKAEVLDQVKGPKIRIVKYKRKKHYRRTMGHRQQYTRIHIVELNGTTFPSQVKWEEPVPALA